MTHTDRQTDRQYTGQKTINSTEPRSTLSALLNAVQAVVDPSIIVLVVEVVVWEAVGG